MTNLVFNTICLILIFICFWRISELGNRLGMNIIVVQSLQKQLDDLKEKK